MAEDIEVYWISGSPFAWRVLLTLELKAVHYRSRLLEASKGEHKSASYLALNPRGKVPTLRHGDFVLSESLAIMAYLDRVFPEPPLFGRSAEETGRVWQRIEDFRDALGPALRALTPIFRGQDPTDEAKAAVGEIRTELAALDRHLAERAWLVGDAISAADVAIHPFLEIVLRIAGKEVAASLGLDLLRFAERHPGLELWRGRIRELRGYERTCPPHWRESSRVAGG